MTLDEALNEIKKLEKEREDFNLLLSIIHKQAALLSPEAFMAWVKRSVSQKI